MSSSVRTAARPTSNRLRTYVVHAAFRQWVLPVIMFLALSSSGPAAAGPGVSITLASSGSTSSFGQAVTFTATVTGTGATPTGTVQFMDGAATLGTPVTLDDTGSATCSTATLSPGGHVISATYSGDTNFAPGVSSLLLQTVNPGPHAVLDWGYNRVGELGNGTTTDSNVPVQVTGISGVVAVAGGYEHSLAFKSDGAVWAWGDNGSGQLGNGSTTNSDVPVQATGLSGVVAIAGGFYHSLAVKNDGTVWAWGYNFYGQLGNGAATDSNVPIQVAGLSGVVAIAGGAFHSLALKSDGTVWAWGNNVKGQLGNGTTTQSDVPVQVTGLSGVVAIAGGEYHSLALKSDGTVWAWGWNRYGQLGNGTTTDTPVPVQVSGISGVVAIAGGELHSLALKSDGTAWAWAYNGDGELGNGSTTDSHVPVQVTGLSGVVAIAAGYVHSLAVKGDGTAWAWGYNGAGELGHGTATQSDVPVQVTGISGVVAIAGADEYSLALGTYTSATALSSSQNPSDYGQSATFTATVTGAGPIPTGTVQFMDGAATLGTPVSLDGTGAATYSTANLSPGGHVIIATYSGDTNFAPGVSSLLLQTVNPGPHAVLACGYNGYGELGNGSTTDSHVPVQVTGLSGAVAIAGTQYHSLALKNDGAVWAWGLNRFGQLGNGSTTDSHVPVQVTELSGVVAIAGGEEHSLALKSDGTVWAWGWNKYGQLGSGSTTDSDAPVQVAGLTGVVVVAGGYYHSLALKSDGTVWAWGYNVYGQLGNGSTTDSDVPVQVAGLSGVVAIAAGLEHSLALKSDGTVWAWGWNGSGDLGNGSTVDSHVPVQVTGLSGVVAIAGGEYHSLALKSDGTVRAWGYNANGQLGNGSTAESHVPVQVADLLGVVAIAGGGNHSLALGMYTSATALSSSQNPSDFGQSVTFTATVTGAGATPTGTVQFMDGATTLGTPVTLDGTGAATYSTSALKVGAHSIKAVYGGDDNFSGSTSNAVSQVVLPAVASLSVSPSSVTGSKSSTGTVTLTSAAPAGGIVVTLGSDKAAAAVPPSVTVLAGKTSAQFTITTTPVSSAVTATITTSTIQASKTAALTIQPPAVFSVSVSPTRVIGSQPAIGSVILNGPAPTGGWVVKLSSSSPVATVSDVTVPAGSSTTTFAVSTNNPSKTTPVTLTATAGGASKSAILVVVPIAVASFTLNPTSVSGGQMSQGTVTLTAPAPTGGQVVTLQYTTFYASVQSSVTVPAGSSSAMFNVQSHRATTTEEAKLYAGSGGVSIIAYLQVVPGVEPASVSLNPSTVAGTLSSTGAVTLTASAPSGGLVVSLSSSNTAVATVPASITVLAGQTSANFTVNTKNPSKTTPVTITASANGVSKSAILVVDPIAVSSFTLNPTSVTGGQVSQGTVTLTAPAPTGGQVVTLQYTTFYASVQSSVTVAAGSSSATFNVQSHPVTTTEEAKLYAGSGGVTIITYLQVKPAPTHAVPAGPQAPSGVSASADSGVVTIRWTAVTGATRYTVKRSLSADGPCDVVGIVQAPTLSYSDTPGGNGVTWYYVVSAGNENGDGPDSTPVAVQP